MAGTRVPVERMRDGKLVKWKEADRLKLDRSLARLMEITVIENGKVVSHHIDVRAAALYVLASLVELCPVPNETDKMMMLSEACGRLRTCAKQDAMTFRRVLAARVRRHLKLPVQRCHFVAPLNVADSSVAGRRWLTVGGLRFTVRSWEYIRDHLAVDEWRKKALVHEIGCGSDVWRCFTPLEVVVPGRSVNEASDAAYDAFELLRAVLNYFEMVGTYTVQGGKSQPLGRIRPPVTYAVFGDDGALLEWYLETNPAMKYSCPNIDVRNVDGALGMLKQLSRARDARATVARIEDAVRKYGRALDTTEWRHAFLNLWQALEILTHEPTGSHSIKSVYERAKLLLGPDPFMKDVLEVCRDARNELVHQGRFSEDGLRAVGMLKMIVGHCIRTVYSLRKACPDWDSLVVYYNNVGTSTPDLARRGRIIRSIERTRSLTD